MSATPSRRLHWLDAVIAGIVIVAVAGSALGYRALRRTQPALAALEPSTIRPASATRVRLRGRELRPFVQAFLVKAGTPFVLHDPSTGFQQATFFLLSTSEAEIESPALPTGVYDLYLYDQGQRLGVLTSALRVAAEVRAPSTIAATVRFFVPAETIPLIRVGDRDKQSTAEVRGLVARAGSIETVDFHLVDRNIFAGPKTFSRVIDATLAVPVTRDDAGVWTSKGMPVRAGEDYVLETGRYALIGLTLDVDTPK